ncbi:heterokaryon incompatibility protein-domain-containing protein [Dactylonectria macrodidyma]|uniref:Heterokaryon incompatibility protein-domain-containing protein n=1 Tax=Dactylonectria macrodidyma TaxID=307937 RepID=A0A9P9EQ59_9HYPO|nr:heterokaryon incompatibility protein-domain-containing protein [Dactylonectria macrodidyma]
MGSARNYYFKAEGRMIHERLLSTLSVIDQEQLSGMEHQPTNNTEPGAEPQEYRYPDLPQGFARSSGLQRSSQHVFGGFEPLAAGSLRLLEISPGREGPISCQFFISKIPDCMFKYEVISYSSQDDATSPAPRFESLYCNGLEIRCSANIASLLHRLRLLDRPRLVWLAPLCINLDDLNERNYHVQLARPIFQHAYHVIVWLGPGADTESDAQVVSLCKIVNTWRRKRHFQECYKEAKSINCRIHAPLQESREMTLPEAWSHAIRFFTRAWFRSVWSLQEASVPRSTVVVLGDSQISWDCIGLAAAILRENFGRVQSSQISDQSDGKRPIVTPGILNAYLVYRVSLSQQYFDPLKLTFHQLLTLTRGFRCKFEHDKIYALLGVPTKDTISSNIVPDYAKPASQVNRDLAILMLRTSNSLDILSQVQIDHSCRYMLPGTLAHRNLILDGPSWVPQWQTNITEPICPLQRCAGFSAATAASPTVQISDDNSKLATLGVIVDTISHPSELRVYNTFWRGQDDSRSNVWGASRPASRPDSFETVLDAAALTMDELEMLALTLTCGKRWDGFPVSNVEGHIADYARCLIRDGLRWSLNWLQEARKQCDINPATDGQNKSITFESLMELSSKGRADRLLDAAGTAGAGRARFVTRLGLLGIGPGATMGGDLLCVIRGAEVPFVVRPLASGGHHLVGECYVNKIMHGEIPESFEKGTNGRLQETWITLV